MSFDSLELFYKGELKAVPDEYTHLYKQFKLKRSLIKIDHYMAFLRKQTFVIVAFRILNFVFHRTFDALFKAIASTFLIVLGKYSRSLRKHWLYFYLPHVQQWAITLVIVIARLGD